MDYFIAKAMGLIWVIKVLLNRKMVYLIELQIYMKSISSFEINTLYT